MLCRTRMILSMTNNDLTSTVNYASQPGATPAALLNDFVDSRGAALILGRTRSTLCDMADRGVLTRYAVGTAVLYWGPEVRDLAAALHRAARSSVRL